MRTSTAVWGKDQLKSLAAYLDLPRLDAKHPIRHICPVCGYTGLQEPASSKRDGSGELCPSCGFDFAGPVDEARRAEWRATWVQNGMPWFSARAGVPAPGDWDPAAQLKVLTD